MPTRAGVGSRCGTFVSYKVLVSRRAAVQHLSTVASGKPQRSARRAKNITLGRLLDEQASGAGSGDREDSRASYSSNYQRCREPRRGCPDSGPSRVAQRWPHRTVSLHARHNRRALEVHRQRPVLRQALRASIPALRILVHASRSKRPVPPDLTSVRRLALWGRYSARRTAIASATQASYLSVAGHLVEPPAASGGSPVDVATQLQADVAGSIHRSAGTTAGTTRGRCQFADGRQGPLHRAL